MVTVVFSKHFLDICNCFAKIILNTLEPYLQSMFTFKLNKMEVVSLIFKTRELFFVNFANQIC